MAKTAEQFVEDLVSSGLLTADDVASVEQDGASQDADALAESLVASGKLTKYQASRIREGKSAGLVLGQYTILDEIGAGGMGEVFKARHGRMERLAAVKVLPEAAVAKPGAVERFHQEVKAAARLTHPNIVMTFDAAEHDGIHYLVMEYVEGSDLAALVKRDGPLPIDRATDFVIQTAQGLAYAHAQGVYHRDIKPGNLLCSNDGTVKILDMGLARLQEGFGSTNPEGPQLTQSGQIMGTVDYMSPEQAEDTRSADHRSDVYSLGCTLYRLLTGEPPYSGDTVMKTLLAHREAPIPSLQKSRPDVPAQIDDVYRKMVAKSPDDRFQSMPELITELKRCLEIPGLGDALPPIERPSESKKTVTSETPTGDITDNPVNVETIDISVDELPSDSSATRIAKPQVQTDSNMMALFALASGVVGICLAVTTGWIPCVGLLIAPFPLILAMACGWAGRKRGREGAPHGGKGTIAIFCGILGMILTIVVQIAGGARIGQFIVNQIQVQVQDIQNWNALAETWKSPSEDADTEILFPAQVGDYQRSSIDGQSAIAELGIDVTGQRAVYNSDDENELFAYRCNSLEREGIFYGIEQAVGDSDEDSSSSPIRSRRQLHGESGEIHLWEIALPSEMTNAAIWWGDDWLFLAKSQGDSMEFLRAFLLSQADAVAKLPPPEVN